MRRVGALTLTRGQCGSLAGSKSSEVVSGRLILEVGGRERKTQAGWVGVASG